MGFRFREVLSVPFSVAAARLARTRRRKIGSLVVPFLCLVRLLATERGMREGGLPVSAGPAEVPAETTDFFGSLFCRTYQKARRNGGLLLFYALLFLCEASRGSFLRVPGGRLTRGKRQRRRAAPSSRKKRVGEGWGAWGEGNTLCASQGVSFPPKKQTADRRSPVRREESFRAARRRGLFCRECCD